MREHCPGCGRAYGVSLTAGDSLRCPVCGQGPMGTSEQPAVSAGRNVYHGLAPGPPCCAGGCVAPRVPGGFYCEFHCEFHRGTLDCRQPGCTAPRVPFGPYCDAHARAAALDASVASTSTGGLSGPVGEPGPLPAANCQQQGCRAARVDGGESCEAHTCRQPGCQAPRVEDGEFCEAHTSRGYVYVLLNPAMPGQLKIGMTDRSPEERAAELSASTGVPTKFVVAYEERVTDPRAAEREVHAALEKHRFSGDREFFQIELKAAIRVVAEACKGYAAPE